MSDLRKAAQQALEQEPDDEPTYCPTCGVEDGGTTCGMPNCGLRCGAEQEQPEPVQEPVAWMYPDDYAGILKHQSRAEVFQKAWCNPAVCVPLYTAPPQQPEPVQEPVAIVRSVVGPGDDGVRIKWLRGFPQIGDPLYTTPPQRKPLTDEEMLGIIDAELEGGSLLDVARAIERKVRGEA